MFKSQTIKLVRKSPANPLMIIWGLKSQLISQMIAILTAKLNKPKVSTFNGHVTTLTSGFMKKLINPSTKPAKSRVLTPDLRSPETENPGTNKAAITNAVKAAIIELIKFLNIIFILRKFFLKSMKKVDFLVSCAKLKMFFGFDKKHWQLKGKGEKMPDDTDNISSIDLFNTYHTGDLTVRIKNVGETVVKASGSVDVGLKKRYSLASSLLLAATDFHAGRAISETKNPLLPRSLEGWKVISFDGVSNRLEVEIVG